ncbi:tetratricopeptide repeat protein [Acaryochloris sp. CCMEE 5410]|uniref:tetratricopeptide repeat protein n=1 Tax=Acaryochloris sp. CCMEE 5410 TaxID=310037 RepID=UPI00024847B1|nr:tetratricopeptide repeat protein [Acaryochloris sp. CCMEE 5410]
MFHIVVFATTGFWMYAIFDCIRNDPDRNVWIWLLLFFNYLGAVIYFATRMLPRMNTSSAPSYFKRWTKGRELRAAEAAVVNIGKSHQYVQLGNVLLEMSKVTQAEEAFQEAISKEPNHLDALWGLASVATSAKRWEEAQAYLQQILSLDSEYKRGDASLLLGKVLVSSEQRELAKPHLIQDIKAWSHPEAALILATLQAEDGEKQDAYDILKAMLSKLKACPEFYYRQHRHIANKADRMLQSLEKEL